MKSTKKYEVNFVGLADGPHSFHYEIGDDFFQGLGYSIIESGKLSVDIILDKSETILVANFDLTGELNVACDKCGDDLVVSVSGKDNLVYKFTEEQLDDEKIRPIREGEFKIDFEQPIYELVALLLPARSVHPKGKCNKKVLSALDEYLLKPSTNDDKPQDDDASEPDPRWDKLKGLKDAE